MMFAAAVGHRSGRATPSLRDAPQRQSMEIVGRETIYRNRNAVQTNPATSLSTLCLHAICFDGCRDARVGAADKSVLDREGSMAGTKVKPTARLRRTTSDVASKQPSRRQTAVVAAVSADANRLLREAAWSQMFGRLESKNPFTRSA